MSGKELEYIRQAVDSGKISGNGIFTHKCHQFFLNQYGFGNVLLTSSCTDALEMAAILLNIKEDDEVIVPSYTFVSTANAFVLRGAKIVFADSNSKNPNIDAEKIESLITKKSIAIVVVHYAGIACDMEKIRDIASRYNLFIVEDAAQAIDSYYNGRALGSLGDLAAFSFHETKNIISGEGGMLVVNDRRFTERSEIVWEKGTNRASFFRGEVSKYGWIDIGSSFLPSEITAAFLYAQLENINEIQKKRKALWNRYYDSLGILEEEGFLKLPWLPSYASKNGHLFYIICRNPEEREKIIAHLKAKGIKAVFHYISLHKSPFYKNKYKGPELAYSDRYSDCLIRLPLFYQLSEEEQEYIISAVKEYYI